MASGGKKVKLRVLIGTQMFGDGSIYKKGETFEFDEDAAYGLIKRGHVEEIVEEEEPIAEEKLTEEALSKLTANELKAVYPDVNQGRTKAEFIENILAMNAVDEG